ncbi:MAG: hypothetical protein J0H96_05045 [Microbacterium ginsengisoli]|nr:hypothetical protein [Microbacterium bovistercoris]MBN9208016.1 hypothetical protein [Microbacterium ginsengisoli]
MPIDSTPMELLVACDGEATRPDLTIMLDAASGSILAGIVTVGTRNTDLVAVLARAVVPHSNRPEGVHVNRRLVSHAWIGDDDALGKNLSGFDTRSRTSFLSRSRPIGASRASRITSSMRAGL